MAVGPRMPVHGGHSNSIFHANDYSSKDSGAKLTLHDTNAPSSAMSNMGSNKHLLAMATGGDMSLTGLGWGGSIKYSKAPTDVTNFDIPSPSSFGKKE